MLYGNLLTPAEYSSGLRLREGADQSEIRGLSIVDFPYHGIHVDGTDDIYYVGEDVTETEFEIVKVSGATGTELWRETMCCGRFSKVAIDGAGNAIAAGITYDAMTDQRDIAVMKYSTDGLEVWDQPVIIAGGSRSTITMTLAVDGSGDILLAGLLNGSVSSGESIVAKLSGASGAELWRQTWASLYSFKWVAADEAGVGRISPAFRTTDTRRSEN